MYDLSGYLGPGMKPPLWSLFLAFLLPAGLLVWVGEYLSRPAPWRPSEDVKLMEAVAAEGPYDVVVIGPSSAKTDIHGPGLGRLLGKGFNRVAVMTQGGSTAPVWYTILKERVYKNGLKPKLVLINGVMQGVVKTRMDAWERGAVLVHTTTPDDVLMRKTWGSGQPVLVQRALERRGDLRRTIFSDFRLFFPGMFLGDAEASVDAAGITVFGRQHQEVERVLPGVETEQGAAALGWDQSNPAESYLADISALAQENGAEVVLVLAPILQAKIRQVHQLSPEAEGKLIQFLNEKRIGLVDLRNAPIRDANFVDGVHMNRSGQKLFTELLAESLLELGAREGRLAPSVEPLIPAGVERRGEGPPIVLGNEVAGKERCSRSIGLPGLDILGARALKLLGSQLLPPLRVVQEGATLKPLERGMLRSDCAGTWVLLHDRLVLSDHTAGATTSVSWNTDLPIEQGSGAPQYWALPGTSLRWQFNERWGVAGPFQVEVSAVAAGSGEPGRLRVGEQERVLEPTLDRLEAQLEVDPSGPWDLELIAPEGGGFLLVRSLVLSYGNQRLELVRDGRPAPWSLLGVDVTGPTPPEVPTGAVQTEGEWSFLDAPWSNTAGCTPLVVLEDGKELPRVKLDNWGAKVPTAEGVAHLGEKLYFQAQPGKDYRLAYAEDRHCWSNRFRSPDHLWLYPGDRLSLDMNQVLTARVQGALRKLEIRARSNEPVPADVTVDLNFLVNDRLHFHSSLVAADINYSTPVLLDPPLLRERDMDVRLELRLPEGSPPLLLTLMGWEG